jgi:kynurenine formamidase
MTPAAASVAAALTSGCRLVDCTHTITPEVVSFAQVFNLMPNARTNRTDGQTDGFQFGGETSINANTDRTPGYVEGRAGFKKCIYCMPCDVGTHIDTPSHWFEGARDASDLTMDELTAAGAVIDMTAKVEADPDYALSLDDLREFEATHGQIPERCFVVMKTGWSRRGIENHEAYVNGGHFPGFSPEAATFLVNERNIVGIGIDTASLDPGTHPNGDFPVHQIVLGADRYQIENMALEEVPPGLETVFVSLPLKVKGGPEAEVRVMAIVKQ